MGKLWVSAKIPGRKKQPASSVLSNEHIAILYPLCAVQRAQQGTAVSTDGMSRILSDGSYNSLFSLDQTILRALETGSVENAAFGEAEQEVQPDRAVLNLL